LKKKGKSSLLPKILAIKLTALKQIGLRGIYLIWRRSRNLRDYKFAKTIPLTILDGPHFRKRQNYPNSPDLKQGHFLVD